MDSENVLTLTSNQDELDADMINWQSMTFAQRKRADDACIRKYGMTNTDLYNKLNDSIAPSDSTTTNESMGMDAFEDRLYRINLSYQLERNNGEVIISDWLDDDHPGHDYLNQLENKWYKYLGLNVDIRGMSDNDSIHIWGKTVYDMYEYLKAKYGTYEAGKEIGLENHSDSLTDYVKYVEETNKYIDPLERKIRELDIVSYEGSLYEGAVLDRLYGTITDPENHRSEFDEDIPMVTPWFTPDEIQDINPDINNPYDYELFHKDKELHESIKKAIMEEDTDTLLRLGWNPSVAYTPESMKYARERQLKWFKENKSIDIIDISRYDVLDEAKIEGKKKNLEPIYITLISHGGINSKVIRAWTRSKYSHAGISLDEKMDNIYSFNASTPDGKSGFSIENIDFYRKAKDVQLTVMVFFVEPKVKKKLKDVIDYYKKNINKTKYDIADIFNVAIGRTKDVGLSLSMICSQFVDSVLKACNLDLTGKPSNLVVPGDFAKNPNSKMFILFSGPISKYKAQPVDVKVKRLLHSDLNPDGLIVKPVDEAVLAIFNRNDLNSFYISTESFQVDRVIDDIQDILEPSACITEAKPLPVRFGKSGNLYLEMPRNLEREYQDAHMLLTTYDETNIEGIKHQLARLFYINSVIEEKIKKKKKDDEEYKQYVDLRARVLNDYKKYMKVVQKAEPNFDFEQYIKNTEFYNKTVVIDKHTLKYSGKAIKSLLSIMK